MGDATSSRTGKPVDSSSSCQVVLPRAHRGHAVRGESMLPYHDHVAIQRTRYYCSIAHRARGLSLFHPGRLAGALGKVQGLSHLYRALLGAFLPHSSLPSRKRCRTSNSNQQQQPPRLHATNSLRRTSSAASRRYTCKYRQNSPLHPTYSADSSSEHVSLFEPSRASLRKTLFTLMPTIPCPARPCNITAIMLPPPDPFQSTAHICLPLVSVVACTSLP
jgi:hypothetical protein